jgi:hypothetical protein
MESVGTRNKDGCLAATDPDAASETSVAPQDDADDLAVTVLPVEERREAEGALREMEDESEAFDRRNGALTDRSAEDMTPREAVGDLA